MVKRLFKEPDERHRILDDRHEILNIYGSQCGRCKHFIQNDYYCPAYPEGIPDGLLEGNASHDKRHPDQTGDTIFEETD